MTTAATSTTPAPDERLLEAPIEHGVLSHVEQRGIEPVPADKRNGTPGQLFWIWFAANISILGIPLGATLIALGLNLWQAVLATAIGAFGSFAVVGVISVAGRRGGAPSLTLSRAIFGVRGNAGPTLVSLVSRLGWETVTTLTGAFALISLYSIATGTTADAKAHPVLTVVCIVIFVALTVVVSATGHAFLLTVQKWATWVFGALTALVALYLATTVDWSAFIGNAPGPASAFVVGIGTIVAGTGVGWANSGADMARYQKLSVKTGSLIASASVGAGIPLVVVIGLGSALTAGNSSIATATDPIAAVHQSLPTWVSVPYLIAAFAGLLMSNHISMYSAGLTTITLGVRIRRVYAVVVDIVVTITGSIYFMLISDSFYGPFISFISVLAVPITAWIGCFLVDMVGRRSYDAHGLLDLRPGARYWYWHGISLAGTGSWLVGLVVGLLFMSAKISDTEIWFAGPLSHTWIGTNGLAWLVSLVVAAGLYALFGGLRRKDDAAAALAAGAAA
ncbi:purine-cytosine permease family protein [Propionibacterium freudenreichii]|uniref:purine-cytosine permease family protein n=1 Tax=Propionibacterium freudenreichii TaxID=1744 RepID=UPI000BC353AD|nr:cytosine permease [Propionibacterium freudenreichii]SBN96361.1 Permease, cytosine/purine, uracil, thiamine, allantoin family [Propionibacterium freudenreichii]SCC97946.1 Permease, cytosine/purine, uracil, thiamine, allantoin family [Propionibacterium freudenreichii]